MNSLCKTTPTRDIALLPLPCPASDSDGTAPMPHRHHCANCGELYVCAGPDQGGMSAPVCTACYASELNSQLRIYRNVVAALARKQRALKKRAGVEACRRAEALRETRRREAHSALGVRVEHSHQWGQSARLGAC